MTTTREQVLAVLRHDDAFTVSKVCTLIFGQSPETWDERTNVRHRLYELEAEGVAICDDEHPQHWMLNELKVGKP